MDSDVIADGVVIVSCYSLLHVVDRSFPLRRLWSGTVRVDIVCAERPSLPWHWERGQKNEMPNYFSSLFVDIFIVITTIGIMKFVKTFWIVF